MGSPSQDTSWFTAQDKTHNVAGEAGVTKPIVEGSGGEDPRLRAAHSPAHLPPLLSVLMPELPLQFHPCSGTLSGQWRPRS